MRYFADFGFSRDVGELVSIVTEQMVKFSARFMDGTLVRVLHQIEGFAEIRIQRHSTSTVTKRDGLVGHRVLPLRIQSIGDKVDIQITVEVVISVGGAHTGSVVIESPLFGLFGKVTAFVDVQPVGAAVAVNVDVQKTVTIKVNERGTHAPHVSGVNSNFFSHIFKF